MTDRAVKPQTLLRPASPEGPVDFRAIYEAEFDYVWHTLRRLCVRPSELEDLAHEVFVVVHKALSSYDPTRPLRPWLFGIAFRVASDHRRSARYRKEIVGEVPEAAHPGPTAEKALVAEERRKLVHEALETLDPGFRAVFVMHELNGHAIPEVAEALGIPLNTAYSRLRLARQKFTQAVRRLSARRGEP